MARHYQAKQQRSGFETLLGGYSRLNVRRQSRRIGEAPRRMRPGLRIGLAGQELRIIGLWRCKADKGYRELEDGMILNNDVKNMW